MMEQEAIGGLVAALAAAMGLIVKMYRDQRNGKAPKGGVTRIMEAGQMVARLDAIEQSVEAIPDLDRRLTKLEAHAETDGVLLSDIHDWLNPKLIDSLPSQLRAIHDDEPSSE